MNEKIQKLLKGKGGNYIFPFFWQHGEEEGVLRKYMEVIEKSNIGAVCVESRPHPDYCGPGWWHDMDIIMDEARKRDMKVWILDDSHFPTGFANGAMEKADPKLARKNMVHQVISCGGAGSEMRLDLSEYREAPEWPLSQVETAMSRGTKPEPLPGDEIISISLIKEGGATEADIIDLTGEAAKDELVFTVPAEGKWNLYICHSTRNSGPHRNYINMMDHDSCRVQIDAVYEPHFAHYADDFGKTLAGFFSDEPELGNGHLYEQQKHVSEMDDLPWSAELGEALKEKWGEKYAAYLPLVWSADFDENLLSGIRFDYMDCVSRLVEKNFSMQLGDWCREHGVEYIGHVIEDNNQHARTGTSLGHYFRGLYGQDMAGIDDIGGQVMPQGEEDADVPTMFGSKREGTFYHYVLGKLGSSAASIEPRKKGRSMCEIFGAYGWSEGVRLEKFLADHFLVRGINHYVPHAFSAMEFPDPDCPPHFYAHGHNPQYRHFGALMKYLNNVCELMNDGHCVAPAAMLYMGEAEWTGDFMLMQEPARKLTDAQIDFEIVPADVFADKEAFRTEIGGLEIGGVFKVNGQEYKVLIVPRTKYLCEAAAKGIADLLAHGIPVIFVEDLPKAVVGGGALPFDTEKCKVVALDKLADELRAMNLAEICIAPASDRVHYRHYENGSPVYMFINEGTENYQGEICVPQTGKLYAYNAWDNRLESVAVKEAEGKTVLDVTLEPLQSLIVIFDEAGDELAAPLAVQVNAAGVQKKDFSEGWTRSTCTSIQYPQFGQGKQVNLPDALETEEPEFSGFVRYEKNLHVEKVPKKMILQISDAYEGVEVFVNGASAGLQIVPTYLYDIAPLMKDGENEIRIEVATTLERYAAKKIPNPYAAMMGGVPEPTVPSGINGRVCLISDLF